MPLANDPLFAAVLAMDSYNRGSDAGLIVSGDAVGTARLKTVALPAGSAAAGFYAQAYDWNNETIISYRGTDVLPGLNLALFNPSTWQDIVAWSVWFSQNYNATQINLAVRFYKEVLSATTGTIETTGHSLGGAMAGFVSSLYGIAGTTFDNIDFRNAVEKLYEAVTIGALDAENNRIVDAGAKAFFYGTSDPTAPNYSAIAQYALQGEIARFARSDSPQIIPVANDLVLGGIASHSQALLVLNLFAQGLGNQDYLAAEKYLFPKLFDDAIATNIGFAKGVTGAGSESNQMLTAIAYSAIANGAQPFGSTAIRALFDDANDLGAAIKLGNVSPAFITAAAPLSAVVAQFAGQLAKGAVKNGDALPGILDLSADKAILSAKLDAATWSLGSGGGNPRANLIGIYDLLDGISKYVTGRDGDIQSGMKWLWGTDSTDVFDKLQLATKNEGMTTTLTERDRPSSLVSMFVAADQRDEITGSSGNDLIFGGKGGDELRGGSGGKDLLAGGVGDDVLHAATGKYYLAGGDDTDTAVFDVGGSKFVLSKDTSSSDAPALLVSYGNNSAELQSVEKLRFTSGVDEIKFLATADLKGLSDIDGGAGKDTLDLGLLPNSYQYKNGTIVGPGGINIKVLNFERVIASVAKDSVIAAKGSVYEIYGQDGDDTIVTGSIQSTAIGGDGTDQLFAGLGGATLDGGVSNGAGDSYVGGSGADIFVIGNGTHAAQGTDALFHISNAGANDKLVLRLANTLGLAAGPSALDKGFVLTGGIQTLHWTIDGVLLQTPYADDPDHVRAVFSSSLINPSAVSSQSSGSISSAHVDGKAMENARPELGNFIVKYDWNKSAATLDIEITTAYGDFAVRVDNFENGQLGLVFADRNEPLDGLTLLSNDAASYLQSSWSGYNNAMRSLLAAAQIVDLPSSGASEPGDYEPIGPTLPTLGFIPEFERHFDPGQGAAFNDSGTGGSSLPQDPNNPNGGSSPKRAAFLDHHRTPLKSDPLVIDLSGDGLHLTREALSDTYVDFTGSGFAGRTGWTLGDDGIVIKYSGSSTISPDTILGATTGDAYADLASFDVNTDGKIDASEATAGSLRIWVDANSDGKVDSSEALTLADAELTSIGLQATTSGQSVNGNTVIKTGGFIRTNGTGGNVYEVNFATNPVLTKTVIPEGFQFLAEALTLPELAGYGHVADLHYDMSIDAALRNEVLQLVLDSEDMSGDAFEAAFEHLVQSWAGASAVDPSSRGPLVNARHLAVVEAFYGQTFDQVNGSGATIDATDAAEIERTYQSILDVMKVRFALQVKDAAIANGATALNVADNPFAVFSAIDYNPATDTIALDWSELLSSVLTAIPANAAERQGYFDSVARVIEGLRVDFYSEDKAALATAFKAAATTAGLGAGWTLQVAAEITATVIIESAGQGSTVAGSSRDEAILASSAHQTLSGGGGADVYIYSAADGNTIIHATGNSSGLILTDIARNDVTFVRNGEDIVVTVGSTGRTITVDGQLNGQGDGTLRYIKFSDGSAMTSWEIASAVNPPNEYIGTSDVDDVVSPGYSNEIYDLKEEDDVLFDRNVNGNTFVYRSGDGSDTYDVSSGQTPTNILKLLDLDPADVAVTRVQGNLLVTVNGTGDVITIAGQFLNAHNGIAEIRFANGTQWSRNTLDGIPDTTPPSTYSINGNPSVIDGGVLQFTVSRSHNDASGPVTLSYNLSGTAIAGADYTAPTGSITFAPGELTKLVNIQTIAHAGAGPDKTVVVTLTSLNGSSGTISTTAGSSDGTIVEGDAPLSILSQILENDTGRSQTDFITQDGHVTLAGTAPAGATVLIFDGSVALGAAVVSGTNWTFSTNLAQGSHRLHAVATDAGTVIATTAEAAPIVVDKTVPSVFTYGPNVFGNDVSIFGRVDPGTTVQFRYYSSGSSIEKAVEIPTTEAGTFNWDAHEFLNSLGTTVGGYFAATDLAGNSTPTMDRNYFLGAGYLQAYQLVGSNSGPNQFSVSAGGSIIFGSGTRNSVTFSPAAGYHTDIDPHGGTGTILLPSTMAQSNVYLQANSFGDLIVKFRDSDSYINAHGALAATPEGVTSAITSIGNGLWSIPLTSVDANPLTFTWLGNTSNYTMYGSTLGTNVYEITSGNGSIYFGNSTAVGGTNIVQYDRGSHNLDVGLNGATGTIELGPNIKAQDLYLQANSYGDLILRFRNDAADNINVHNDLSVVSGHTVSAIGVIRFDDGTTIDLSQPLTFTWLGNSPNYTLYGSVFGTNIYEITQGNGSIYFGDTSAVGGTNIVEYGRGDKLLDVNLNGGTGIIAFEDVHSSDVYWQANSFGDLILKIRNSDADSITIHNDLAVVNGHVTSGIEQLQFADGSVVDFSQGDILNFHWLGNTPNYTLYGSNFGTNIFEISNSGTVYLGNSTAVGGTNIIEYSRGDGLLDVGVNGATGSVTFASDIASQDVYWQANSFGDLILKVRNDDTDSINFHGALTSSGGVVTSALRTLTFADGSTVDFSQGLSFTWLGGPGNISLTGSNLGSNLFDVSPGGETITFGNATGGGDGHNTIAFEEGDGAVSVNLNGGHGTIKLGPGIAADDVLLHANGNDLVLRIGGGNDTISIQSDLSNGRNGLPSLIDTIIFADGTIWDRAYIESNASIFGTANSETIYGNSYADVIDGLAGDDNLRGQGGGDTYICRSGSGNDTISESSSDSGADIVKLIGLNASDVEFSRNANDLFIKITATDEILKVENQFNGTNGIEEIVFADGTTWGRTQIVDVAWFRGTSGNDWTSGTSSADVFYGGQGNDYAKGNAGADTYIYASGHGNDEIDDQSNSTTDIDTLSFTNLNEGDITVSRVGSHLMVGINATGETIQIDYQFYTPNENWGIEKFEFANGSTWDLQTINANAWYRGTSGNDSITGTSWKETFVGELGNDYLRGNDGADTYVYTSGQGNDEIDDQSASTTDIDTLKFTDLNASDITLSRVAEHIFVKVNATGETIKIDYQFYTQNGNYGIEKFEFANGTTWNHQTINANAWYRGTSGDDTISGSSWNDTIAGGAGNDILSGNSGNDTFVFQSEPGQDIVTDFTAGSDVLEFRDGIFADAATALAAASASGNNTLITIDSGNSILLQNVSLAGLSQGDFHIA